MYDTVSEAIASATAKSDAEAEDNLKTKASDAGRDWGQEEKETTEDEMAGWHH